MAVGATIWVVLTVTGFGLLRAMQYVDKPLLDAILVRSAAFSFAGAGMIGASGWLGDLMSGLVSAINSAGERAGAAALGTSAIWVVWLLASVAWVLTLLPEKWFKAAMPDWLSVSGLVLPGLAASIPGPIGDFVSGLIEAAGQMMIELVRQGVSG